MKISIKWILLLTVFACFHLSLSNDASYRLLAVSALVGLSLLPAVFFCKWRIDDVNGWWKFQGSKFARIVVWCYFLAALNIVAAVVRLVFETPNLGFR